MLRHLLLGALAAGASAALAVSLVSCQRGQFAQQPPAEFQGDRIVLVQFVAAEKVDAACKAWGTFPELKPGQYLSGCYTRGKVMILPNPCAWPNDSDMRQVLCHELGHANGWPANHTLGAH